MPTQISPGSLRPPFRCASKSRGAGTVVGHRSGPVSWPVLGPIGLDGVPAPPCAMGIRTSGARSGERLSAVVRGAVRGGWCFMVLSQGEVELRKTESGASWLAILARDSLVL